MSLAEAMIRIDRAAPFIDAKFDGKGWKPSELLRIGWCALATGRRPSAADEYLDDQLEAARQRFREGLL